MTIRRSSTCGCGRGRIVELLLGRRKRGSVSIDRREHLIRVYEDIFFVGVAHCYRGAGVYLKIGLGVLFLLIFVLFFQDSPGGVYDGSKCQSCTLVKCSMGPWRSAEFLTGVVNCAHCNSSGPKVHEDLRNG